MTASERTVLRHQIDARVRELARVDEQRLSPRPAGQVPLGALEGEWLPFARVPKRAAIAHARS